MRLLSSNGFRDYLEPIFTGISVPHLSPEQIRAFPVALPPLEEQIVIAQCVELAVNQVNVTQDRQRKEIALIQEYRTRLTSDVMTGKLDVRSIELPLSVVGSTK